MLQRCINKVARYKANIRKNKLHCYMLFRTLETQAYKATQFTVPSRHTPGRSVVHTLKLETWWGKK